MEILEIGEWLTKNWSTISAAPVPFVLAIGFGGGAGYWLANKQSAGQIKQKDERIEHLRDEIAAADARTQHAIELSEELKRKLGQYPGLKDPYSQLTRTELRTNVLALADALFELAKRADYELISIHSASTSRQAESQAAGWDEQIAMCVRAHVDLNLEYDRLHKANALGMFDELLNRGVHMASRDIESNRWQIGLPTNSVGIRDVATLLSTMAKRMPG
ncbi:hypothetical protein ACT2E5_13800 [Burkholderia vietnamiensis]|uniref:hypothetical protein n=1 Tax=Burkholderia vietnamiensis TaxID=60552 RepID=UPI00402AE8B5